MIAAEGEHKASRALRHAAEVIAGSPAALQVNDDHDDDNDDDEDDDDDEGPTRIFPPVIFPPGGNMS